MSDQQTESVGGSTAPDRGSVLPIGDPGPRSPGSSGRRRARKQRASGCLPVLLVLVIVGGLLYGGIFGVNLAGVKFDGVIKTVQDSLADPEDFPGPGTGEVLFEVASGDSITTMGDNLQTQGVVASSEAFTEAAGATDSTGIQPGFYSLRAEMAAEDVVDVLVDPDNIVSNAVTIPEGLTVNQILDTLAEDTDFRRAQFERVIDGGRLDLPRSAGGDPEGYLFPATYPFGPDAGPRDMLQAMVDRWDQAAADTDLVAGARRLDLSVQEVMTVAAMVQAEGRGDDMPKVARVIYNRVADVDGETEGFLKIDATVNYALGESPIARLTLDEIDSVADSPYNTYTMRGLPPGPIEAPGEDAIAAALNPAEGDWLYYVTVNLETGETKFADDGEEFNRFRAELDDYCETQSDRC